MTAGTAEWLFKRKFGCCSLALCLVETAVIWGGIDLVQMMLGPSQMRMTVKLAEATWLFAGPTSFAVAIAGFVTDSYRLTASFALAVSVLAFMFCGLRMLA
jgi:hypothetical protein